MFSPEASVAGDQRMHLRKAERPDHKLRRSFIAEAGEVLVIVLVVAYCYVVGTLMQAAFRFLGFDVFGAGSPGGRT